MSRMVCKITGLWLSLIFSAYAGFFQNHQEGWHWYNILQSFEEEPIESSTSSSQSPTEILKAYQRELEKKLHKAWINPTPQNVQDYQEMQKDMLNRSQLFSVRWMQNVFQNPLLDHTLVAPTNQQGRHLQIDLKKHHKEEVIKKLSKAYGLFFFFSSDCSYCHQFAPIVKRFADTYDWDVVAISVDGGPVAEFPHAELDNGLFEAWNIKALPALFAVNPQTQEVLPIAYGLTSIDEMEKRIMTLLEGKSAA